MGFIKDNSYKPPYWLPNGHLQTVYPSLFRKVTGVDYRRERLATPDGDFLLLDWSRSSPFASAKKYSGKAPLVILSHGFEGDSRRPYVTGMVRELGSAGFDCLAWNFRSCGGEMNLGPGFYHSGATDDLNHVIEHAVSLGYRQIYLVGFSLGGNLTLKYLGEKRIRPANIVKAICFSVPLDLAACSLHLDRFLNRVYQRRFLDTLRVKIRQKGLAHPACINVRLLERVRSVYTFDDVFTAPLHGFEDAVDYYTQCSAKHYLASVGVPTLIVNAENDPMIPRASLPRELIAGLSMVDLRLTPEGGHCGFLHTNGAYWSEEVARRFFVEMREG